LDNVCGNNLVLSFDSLLKRHTMSNGELEFPKWQAPLQEVILEFDREELPEKIQKVEALILDRLQELSHSSDGHAELDALNYALRVLRTLKVEKLDFPDWK
jgi:hypothetical protein